MKENLIIDKKDTLIIDGVEYERKEHDFNKKFYDIITPKGWRLWKAEECIKLFNLHEKKLNLSDCWFFIEQPIKKFKNRYVAILNTDSQGLFIACGGNPNGISSSLGVRYCRDLKKRKEIK